MYKYIMDKPIKSQEVVDPCYFENVQAKIEKEISALKKIVNNVNQMRVEAAYLESDLMLMMDAATWADISELIGMTSLNMFDVAFKNNTKTE